MKETVSVDAAIRKGHWMVTYPSIALMIGVSGISIYAGANHLLPGWTIIIGVVMAFAAGWLYWSWKITKWRLWAFENVRDLRELKKRAVLENLIWEEGSWFEKTEIRNSEEQKKWKQLKNKVQIKEAYKDDETIPPEAVIGISKGKILVELAVILFILGEGIYLFFFGEQTILGLFFGVLAIMGLVRNTKKLLDKKTQLILNEKGLEMNATGFISWEQVFNEDVVGRRAGKYTNFYLVFESPNENHLLLIDDLDTDYQKLQHLLRVYRFRYEKEKSAIEQDSLN